MNATNNNLTNVTKQSFFKSYITNFNLKIYKYSLLKMLKSVGGGIYILLLTFIAFIIPGILLIFRFSNLSDMSNYWMKVNKYFLIVGITFIFTSLKVMQIFRNDIKDGTLLILLSKPISRTRIYLQKYFAIFTMIVIVSIFYLLFTNLPLYLIIKNIDPKKPYHWPNYQGEYDYTSDNLPLINNLISDITAHIAYGLLNLIIVLITSSLFIMLTMVFQNIKLTLFAPLIGMGVVMFNTESLLMATILKNSNFHNNNTKNIDSNFATPLMLFNDLKNSSDENKKNIWKDIQNIVNSTKKIQKEDFFDFKKEAKLGLSNEQKIERLKNNIFANLKVWKLDFEKEVNIDENNELFVFLKDRIKQIKSIKTNINDANTPLNKLKKERNDLEEEIELKKKALNKFFDLKLRKEVEKLEYTINEIKIKIDKQNKKINQLKTQKEKLKRIIDNKRYWDNRNDNNYLNWKKVETLNNSIKQTIYNNLLSTFYVNNDVNYNEVLNLGKDSNPLLNLNTIHNYPYIPRTDYPDDHYVKIDDKDEKQHKDYFINKILANTINVEDVENELKKAIKIETAKLIWEKIFPKWKINFSKNYYKSDLLDLIMDFSQNQTIFYSETNLEEYNSKVKTKKWISWLSPFEHLSYILEGYNSNPNIYDYLINPNFNAKDNSKYLENEMFDNNQQSIFKKIETKGSWSQNKEFYYEVDSNNLFNNEKSKIKVKYFLNWHIVLSIYIILSIVFFSLALLKFKKTDFN